VIVTTHTCIKGFSISTVALVFSLELQNEIFTIEALSIEGTTMCISVLYRKIVTICIVRSVQHK